MKKARVMEMSRRKRKKHQRFDKRTEAPVQAVDVAALPAQKEPTQIPADQLQSLVRLYEALKNRELALMEKCPFPARTQKATRWWRESTTRLFVLDAEIDEAFQAVEMSLYEEGDSA